MANPTLRIHSTLRRRSLTAVAAAAAVLLLAGCAADGDAGGSAATADNTALAERLDDLDVAVRQWQQASTLAEARHFAEEARNLVEGPAGPRYGDADQDGTIDGSNDIGVLPGLGGEPGLAREDDGACVVRDVLGGSWAEPEARWATFDTVLASWSPSNNTFPTLPSHPQRIVGWASLTLDGADLREAVEFAGHAALHVAVSQNALSCG